MKEIEKDALIIEYAVRCFEMEQVARGIANEYAKKLYKGVTFLCPSPT